MTKPFAAAALLGLVALAAVLAPAAAAPAAPQQPSIASTFTAYVNTTMPFFGTVPAKMYYDLSASSMRFDFVTWGTTSYLVQRYDLATQYNIVPDSKQCEPEDLDPTMPSLSMPPGCTFVRNTTFEGNEVQEWHAEFFGMGATWLVKVVDDKHAHLVRYQTTGLPINLDLVVDPGTVDEAPIPPSVFDVSQYPYCKKPAPVETFSVSGYVLDASTGRLVPGNPQVTVDGDLSSSANPFTFDKVPAGVHKFKVAVDGYAGAEREVNVTRDIRAGTTVDFALSKLLPSESWFRFVLTWGEFPADLDSYMFTPGGCIVKYSNRACGTTTLDHDDTASYGPETITCEAKSGVYTHQVKVYTSDANLGGSNAQVVVYQGSNPTPVQVLNVDPHTHFPVWDTFRIENGVLSVVNRLHGY